MTRNARWYAATVRLLAHIEQRAQGRDEPLQLWATLCGDTMDNAVYAHSPNPNGTPYPNAFDDTEWGAPVPEPCVPLAGDNGASTRAR